MKSRPKLLTWLCVGSALFSSSWIVMLISLMAFSVRGQIPSGLFPVLAVEYLKAGYLFISALVLLAFFSLFGVLLMWQSKKAGFYTYSISKINIYFLPVLFIGYQQLTFPGLILTSFMIVLFGTIFFRKPAP